MDHLEPETPPFDYREHVESLTTALREWAEAQGCFEQAPEPSALDPAGVPYVVLAVGMTVTPDDMLNRFVPMSRRLYHRVQHALQRLTSVQGDVWVRRWPEIAWQPPWEELFGEPPSPNGVLYSAVRLSRKDGRAVDDSSLGMWIKPEGEIVHLDATLADKYA
jgi:hypothetical protein